MVTSQLNLDSLNAGRRNNSEANIATTQRKSWQGQFLTSKHGHLTVDPPTTKGSSSTGLGSIIDRSHLSGAGGKGKAGGKSVPHIEKSENPPTWDK